MAITTSDFRPGIVIKYKNNLMQVQGYQHVKPGKGPAFVRVKMRNLLTGSIIEVKLRPSEKYEEVRVENRKFDYLYPEGDMLVIMDKETYDQINIPKTMLGKQIGLLTENEELTVAISDGEAITAELPLNVVREITFCEPGVKGDTATGATKQAVVEGGATINVPLFLNQGDKIRVDTKEFKYQERVRN